MRKKQFTFVPLFGDITWDSVKTLFNSISNITNPSENLLVLISSQGGDSSAGLCLYTLLKRSGFSIITVGPGKIFSAAVFPFLAGVKRYIFPETYFLFHPTRIDFQRHETREIIELKEEILGEEIDEKLFEDMLKDKLKVSPNIKDLIIRPKGSFYVTAKDAVNYGLATHLIQSITEIK